MKKDVREGCPPSKHENHLTIGVGENHLKACDQKPEVPGLHHDDESVALVIGMYRWFIGRR